MLEVSGIEASGVKVSDQYSVRGYFHKDPKKPTLSFGDISQKILTFKAFET